MNTLENHIVSVCKCISHICLNVYMFVCVYSVIKIQNKLYFVHIYNNFKLTL